MLSFSAEHFLKYIKSKTLSLIKSKKRVSSLCSFCLKGGMAFEGCLIIPLFLFFSGTLLYSLEIIRFESNAWEAVHQAGSAVCFSSATKEVPFLCVKQELEGVCFSEDRKGNGEVKVTVSYTVNPFADFLPIGKRHVSDSFYGHDFAGYRKEIQENQEEDGEVYVYITETGNKYHFSKDCTYLKVPIEAQYGEQVSGIRNASGEKYYACERCRPVERGLVYLTAWGNRYHASTDCPALKRTVYLVPLSQAGDRTPCGKCG